jgi:RHS repeat-associated protein
LGLPWGLPEHRLWSVLVGGDTTMAWIYPSALLRLPALLRGDGDGALVKREVGGETTVYPSASLRTGVGNLYEKDVAGGQVRKYYYFPSTRLRTGAGQRVALRKAGVLQYVLGDHLGSTSVVLNDDGTVDSEARYYPYGVTRWSSGTLPTDYRFTGERLEQSLDIYVMGARWFDPSLARWISVDTLVPEPDDPQSFNRYSFVLGSPLRYVDPTGHKEEGECGPTDNCNGIDDAVYELYQQLGLEGIADYATFSAHIQALAEGNILPSVARIGVGGNPWPVDAIGWRIDLSAMPLMFGGDANVDVLYNLNSGEADVFLGLSAQAVGEGASINTGPVFVFGLAENAGYEGGGVYVGGTAVAELGVEGDLCVSISEYQGERPIAGFIGLGGGAEVSAYAGVGGTFRITDIVIELFPSLAGFLSGGDW